MKTVILYFWSILNEISAFKIIMDEGVLRLIKTFHRVDCHKIEIFDIISHILTDMKSVEMADIHTDFPSSRPKIVFGSFLHNQECPTESSRSAERGRA